MMNGYIYLDLKKYTNLDVLSNGLVDLNQYINETDIQTITNDSKYALSDEQYNNIVNVLNSNKPVMTEFYGHEDTHFKGFINTYYENGYYRFTIPYNSGYSNQNNVIIVGTNDNGVHFIVTSEDYIY